MGLFNKIKKKSEEKKKSDVDKTPVQVEKKEIEVPNTTPKVKTIEKSISTKGKKKKDDEGAHRVIAYPLITEKATDLAQMNKYVFVVPVKVNKNEILKTIINVYGVTPVKINIIKKSGKKVRHGRRFGKTKDFKKAIVTLRSEDRIEVYEGV